MVPVAAFRLSLFNDLESPFVRGEAGTPFTLRWDSQLSRHRAKSPPPPRRRVACHGLFRSPFHFAVRSGAGSVSITGRTGWCWAWWPPAHEVRRPLPSPAPPAPGSRDSAHPAFSLLAAPPVWPVNSREGRATALEPRLLSVFLARVSTSLGAGPTHTGEFGWGFRTF